MRERPDPMQPENAWLLIGDEASFPSAEELAEMRSAAQAGVYDNDWTAPMNGAEGDLVLIYFMAPRKAAHFVARLASLPFWDSEVEVNALTPVDPHQWWAYTTAFIEIEPIPFRAIQEAQDGFLVLKGRSGKYLYPETIAALTFTAKNPTQQPELDLVAQRPQGDSRLPDKKTMTLGEWKSIPSGLLPLEAKVSEYIVEPLAEFITSAPHWFGPTLTLKREHKVPKGSVDFLMIVDEVPVAAVEVKLAVRRPANGVWADSPDFQQLKRYMDHLQLPGILIDAHSILLVDPGDDSPRDEFARADASTGMVDRIGVFIQNHASKKAADLKRRGLDVYMLCLPVWGDRARVQQVTVVALLASSSDNPAVEALPIIDIPIFRQMAERFLLGNACGSVAEIELGGFLMDPHSVATLLGMPLPDERPELLRMLGNLYAPRQSPVRRVARRG